MALYDKEKEKGIDNRLKKKPVAQNKNKRSEPSVSKSNTNARQGLRSSNTTNTSGSIVPLSATESNVNSSFLGDTARGMGRSLRTIAPNLEGTGVDPSIASGEKRLFRSPDKQEWTGSAGNSDKTKKSSDEVLSNRAEKQIGANNPDAWSSVGSRYKKTGDVAGFNQIRDTKTGKDNIYTNLNAEAYRGRADNQSGPSIWMQSNSSSSGPVYGEDSMENYMRELRNKQETHAYNRGLEVDARKAMWKADNANDEATARSYRKQAGELRKQLTDPGSTAANTRMQSFNTEAETNRQGNELAYDATMTEEQGKQERAQQERQQKLVDEARKNFSSTSIDMMTEEVYEDGVLKGEQVNQEMLNNADWIRRNRPELSETQSVSIAKQFDDAVKLAKKDDEFPMPSREALYDLIMNPTEYKEREYLSKYKWTPDGLR